MTGSVLIPGMSRAVRDGIYDHVFGHQPKEVGGVLVGQLEAEGPPAIAGAIPALGARGGRASLTFTHEAWAQIHARLDADFPGQQLVGWYHSHPGFGIFLSEEDRFIQRSFFADERQIAYVIDPQAGTEGLFGWRDGEVVLLEQHETARPGTGTGRRLVVEVDPAAQPPRRVVVPPPLQSAPARARRRWRPNAVVVVAILAAIVVAVVLAMSLGSGGEEPARPATTLTSPPPRQQAPPPPSRSAPAPAPADSQPRQYSGGPPALAPPAAS